jgi:hypothetical protein
VGATEGTVATTLAAIKDWTVILGPGWVVIWGFKRDAPILRADAGRTRAEALPEPTPA